MRLDQIANDALATMKGHSNRDEGMRQAIIRADILASREPKDVTDEVLKSALIAYDASEDMNREHIASGILPRDASKNFSMQAAITAANEHRDTGTATIFVRDDGSFPSAN